MADKGYRTSILVDRSPSEAFRAVNDPRGWWSEEIEGATTKVGDVFTHRFEEVHRCKIEVSELTPDRRVVWRVLENYFDFTADKTEWIGTRIIFEIAPKNGKTEIQFMHEGLTPQYECFDLCSDAWGSYIRGSLKSLIETGQGHPNRKG